MPLIKISYRKGTLSAKDRGEIAEKITLEAIKFEAGDNLANMFNVRTIAWCMFNELEENMWAVGGHFDDEYRVKGGSFLIELTVPEPNLSKEDKKNAIEGFYEVMRPYEEEIPGKEAGFSTWVIIREVPMSQMTANGTIVDAGGLFDFVGVPRTDHRYVRAAAWEEAKAKFVESAGFPQ